MQRLGWHRIMVGRPGHRRSDGMEELPVEMVIGIALVVISAIEIWVIVRAVSANLNLGR